MCWEDSVIRKMFATQARGPAPVEKQARLCLSIIAELKWLAQKHSASHWPASLANQGSLGLVRDLVPKNMVENDRERCPLACLGMYTYPVVVWMKMAPLGSYI